MHYLPKGKNKCHWQYNSKNRIEDPVKEYRESLKRPQRSKQKSHWLKQKNMKKAREKNGFSVYKQLNNQKWSTGKKYTCVSTKLGESTTNEVGKSLQILMSKIHSAELTKYTNGANKDTDMNVTKPLSS